MGQYDLVPQDPLRRYLDDLKPLVLDLCPAADRALLAQNLSLLGKTENILAAPVEILSRQGGLAAGGGTLATDALRTEASFPEGASHLRDLSLLIERLGPMLASGPMAALGEPRGGTGAARAGVGARRGRSGGRRTRGRGGRRRSARGERGATRRPSVADSLGGGDGGPHRCRTARRSRQAPEHGGRGPDRRAVPHARPLGSPVVRLGAVDSPRARLSWPRSGPRRRRCAESSRCPRIPRRSAGASARW